MTKILIVDDEPMVLMVTKQILSAEYEIICANNAREALDIYPKEKPDMILTDLLMPGMNGFEMHQTLLETYGDKVPIMYMTADDAEETEGKGFDLGAADFIHKPFRADVLLRRVKNILDSREKIRDLTEEANMDQMTGLLNKSGSLRALTEACAEKEGYLLMIDLDSFKLVNDLYGHDFGDSILKCFADLMRKHLTDEDVRGRIGGDEFTGFMTGAREETRVATFAKVMNEEFLQGAKAILGEDMNIPLGVSVGAIAVPEFGRDYDELFKLADHALYGVKQNGKHGYGIYAVEQEAEDSAATPEEEMDRLSKVLQERNVSDRALWLGQDAFASVYRFLVRFVTRYEGVAHKILFTLTPKDPTMSAEEFENVVQAFGEALSKHLRKSDLMMQSKKNQFFLLLPELDRDYVELVVSRVIQSFEQEGYHDVVDIRHVAAFLQDDAE